MRQYGWAALLCTGFGVYVGVIMFSFARWPADIPGAVSAICFGNMEQEIYGLLWPQYEDVPADTVDTTWRVPAVFGALLILMFARELIRQHRGLA